MSPAGPRCHSRRHSRGTNSGKKASAAITSARALMIVAAMAKYRRQAVHTRMEARASTAGRAGLERSRPRSVPPERPRAGS